MYLPSIQIFYQQVIFTKIILRTVSLRTKRFLIFIDAIQQFRSFYMNVLKFKKLKIIVFN